VRGLLGVVSDGSVVAPRPFGDGVPVPHLAHVQHVVGLGEVLVGDYLAALFRSCGA